jgi:hypothetical protein
MRVRAWPFAIATLALAGPALADTTTDCIDANEKSIQLRKDHKLVEARVEVARCAAMACSEDIRELCTDRANKLNDAIPSIVFDVKDGKGQDLTGVKVTVDGATPSSDPTVTALDLDPGPHTFVFERGGDRVERSFVLRDGEKQRRESIVLGAAPPLPPPVTIPATVPQTSTAPPPNAHPLRTLGIAAGGISVGALILGGVFGGVAAAKWSSSQNECSPGCQPTAHSQAVSDHDSALTFATASTVGFVAGGVLLTGGVAFFFWPAARKDAAAWTVSPMFGSGQAGAALGGRF